MGKTNRREFFQEVSLGGTLLAASGLTYAQNQEEVPWYRRTVRWGQTNINEMDPTRYDIGWWRQHWKRTKVQGLVINAGGIVAYYPSRYPLQYRARTLGNRDLFGELVQAAHTDGIAVLARMDSNRAHEAFFNAHRDWFAINRKGVPYRAGDLYISCVSSPYYDQFIPDVLREVIEKYHPEGFTDNSWSGLNRDEICYCRHCKRRFHDYSGENLPDRKNWEDTKYRKWIEWSYQRRVDLWDLNNKVTKSFGGKHCIWMGMIGGNMTWEARRFRDARLICQRAEMIMFDDQGRSNRGGFQANAEMGKRIHEVLGWQKLIPESMATYQRSPTFRKAAAPPAESRMWMIEGIAGGIQPWWHHVGAYQEDRRQFKTAEPIYLWHEKNEQFIVNRQPVATVGVVWSQRNTDFYGRDDSDDRVVRPYEGINQALVRKRIVSIPVHIDHIDRHARSLKLLILPNIAAMSDPQVESIRRFVSNGGSIIASGKTSLLDEWGDQREDFALADLFGVTSLKDVSGPDNLDGTEHSYLRLTPDVGKDVYGPQSGNEPAESLARHPVLDGFSETNILAFGGQLEKVRPNENTEVPLTLIPNFPIYPPETSWMREPRTDIPCLVLRDLGASRIAYLPADLDRRFALHNFPDHGNLLANIVRWAHTSALPLEIKGTGLIDCHLYRQPNRLILHVVNLTSAGSWRSPTDELIRVGPFSVEISTSHLPQAARVRTLVSESEIPSQQTDQKIRFEIDSILDHEVLVIS